MRVPIASTARKAMEPQAHWEVADCGGAGSRRREGRGRHVRGGARAAPGYEASVSPVQSRGKPEKESRHTQSSLSHPNQETHKVRALFPKKKSLLWLTAQMGTGTSPLLDRSVTLQNCAIFHLPTAVSALRRLCWLTCRESKCPWLGYDRWG